MNLFVCGGGTGGHFFSGVAVAENFLKTFPSGKVLFVGTRYGIEARTPISHPQMSIRFILARGVKGRGPTKALIALSMMLIGVVQSCYLLLRYRPRLVVGVGGYASAPTVFSALILKIFMGWKVFVLEQNSYAGLANRLLVRLGACGISAFACKGFKRIDLPLRESFLEAARAKRAKQWPPRSILVLGGSQGASGLNKRWLSIVEKLTVENVTAEKVILDKNQERLKDLKIFHQTGAQDFESVRAAYSRLGFRAEVFPFSNEMHRYFDAADLLVCRAGAMTVFESILFECPAIYIPFPRATDDHQTKNALSVQSSDWVIREEDFNETRLLSLLKAHRPFVPKPKEKAETTWHDVFAI